MDFESLKNCAFLLGLDFAIEIEVVVVYLPSTMMNIKSLLYLLFSASELNGMVELSGSSASLTLLLGVLSLQESSSSTVPVLGHLSGSIAGV